VAAYLKLPQPKTWQAWLWIGLFALVDGAMFQGFLTTGLVHTGAGIGAVLIDAQPLVVALLSRWLFAEIIGFWGWLGLFIGILGICLCGLPESWLYDLFDGGIDVADVIASGGQLTVSSILESGELLMVLAALSMSLGTIIVRYVKEYADPLVATGWHMILGGIPLIVMSWFWETNQISNLQLNDWLGLSYATIFGTAITYGIFFYLAAKGNITSVSALIFLTPVFALLLSNLLLDEQLTILQWIGVGFTLISVYLVNQRLEISKGLSALKAATVIAETETPRE
jgi:drug/metabolite transporter (DMT)-like permease